MPVARNDEACSITTVYMYTWQIEWMNKNGVKRSEFVRQAISDRIEQLGGFSPRLRTLRTKRDEALHTLHELEEQILEVERLRTDSAKLGDLDKARRKLVLMRRYGGGAAGPAVITEVLAEFQSLTRADILELIEETSNKEAY